MKEENTITLTESHYFSRPSINQEDEICTYFSVQPSMNEVCSLVEVQALQKKLQGTVCITE